MSEENDCETQFVNFPASLLPQDRAIAVMEGPMLSQSSLFSEPSYLRTADIAQKSAIVVIADVQCPPKPLRLPTNTFCYCNRRDFALLRNELQTILDNFPNFDFSFDCEKCLWRGKLVDGARSLEVVVNCYWDRKLQDHIVSVRKVCGDAVQVSAAHLYDNIVEELESKLFAPSSPPHSAFLQKLVVKKRHVVAPQSFLSISQRTTVQIQESLLRLVAMLNSNFVDSRQEAAKMFCEMVTSSSLSLFDDPCVQSLVLLILQSLLSDRSDEESQQCVVVAILSLVREHREAVCQSYLNKIFEVQPIISALVSLVSNPEVRTQAYLTVATRRGASEILARLSHVNGSLLCSELQRAGFVDRRQWLRHGQELIDVRMQAFANEISYCFDN